MDLKSKKGRLESLRTYYELLTVSLNFQIFELEERGNFINQIIVNNVFEILIDKNISGNNFLLIVIFDFLQKLIEI